MEKFDVIVVGAGPAGSTAAYLMARGGLKVLLLERGKSPGEKNIFGGRIYSHVLKRIFGNFGDEAPVERYVVRESLGLMTDSDCTLLDFSSRRRGTRDASSFIARRSRFDKWLSERAEAEGALLVTGTRVDDLYIENGEIRGIISAGESIDADCVVDAEGVSATLARRGGLRSDVLPGQVKVGVKETVKLSREQVNDRFSLEDDEGAASVFIGYPAGYLEASGAFIYTNSDSVSIGVVADPVKLSASRIEVQRLVEDFRLHPFMRRLLRGGSVIEYSAHMIPNSVPVAPENLVRGNFIAAGDAAGLFINHGFTYRGVDLAMASGEAAAKAVVAAHSSGGYSREQLASYHSHLAEAVLPELERAERGADVLHNPRIFSDYTHLISDFMSDLFSIDGFGHGSVSSILSENMKGKVSRIRMLRDMLSAYRKM